MLEAILTGVRVAPLGDRVLVRPLEKKEAKSGLVIPDTAKEKPHQGEVTAVGKGKITAEGKLIPVEVKVGDTVLYGKYSGTEIKIDDVDYLILQQDDILGIIVPQESEDMDFYTETEGD